MEQLFQEESCGQQFKCCEESTFGFGNVEFFWRRFWRSLEDKGQIEVGSKNNRIRINVSNLSQLF